MKPLEGIKVLDFTQFTAGPVCTYILADFGAEVYKLENPPYGDQNHYTAPTKNKQSIFITSLNHSKKSVLINMKDPTQKEIFFDMVKSADVVIDNFKAGQLGKFGITYDVLKEINPRIIWTKMCGFGEAPGPWRNRAAYDLAIQAASGLMSVTGEVGGSPLKLGFSLSDVTSGLYAAIATIAALYDVKRTGIGRYIDLAMLDGSFLMTTQFASRYLMDGNVAGAMGTKHADFVPSGVYTAKNGEDVVISIRNDAQFAGLCRALGCEDLVSDDRFARRIARTCNRNALEEILAAKLAAYTTAQLCEMLLKEGVPCSPVNNLKDTSDTKQAKVRRMVMVDCKYPDGDTWEVVGTPLKISDVDECEEFFCHPLGYDTVDVYAQYVGEERAHEIFDPIVKDSNEKWAIRAAGLS